MKTIMMNMIRIFNDNEVVVLDKVKKYGWEGLTFPGGKVEAFETFEEAAIREAKEETDLDVSDLTMDGIIVWYDYDNDERLVGILYTARAFTGKLCPINKEGKLYFQDYDEFKKEKTKSDSMDDILSIYDGKYKEVCLYYKNNELIESRRN